MYKNFKNKIKNNDNVIATLYLKKYLIILFAISITI